MSTEGPVTASQNEKKFKPYVPENMEMREFTWRAILLLSLIHISEPTRPY